MDDLDLDNIETLTWERVGEAIDRTMDRLERLQALSMAIMEGDRRRIERLVREYRRQQRGEGSQGDDRGSSSPEGTGSD